MVSNVIYCMKGCDRREMGRDGEMGRGGRRGILV